jgi:hypothetical protein
MDEAHAMTRDMDQFLRSGVRRDEDARFLVCYFFV